MKYKNTFKAIGMYVFVFIIIVMFAVMTVFGVGILLKPIP